MAKYDFQLDKLCGMIAEVRKEQSQIMHSILHEEGSLGGLICPVDGINGHYEVESVFLWGDDRSESIRCHLNYKSFEVDVEFNDLSPSERQQIIEGAINLVNKL